MIDRLYRCGELYLICLTLWELPLFLLLEDSHCTDRFGVIFYIDVSDMSWDETLALPVIYTLHPTAEDHGMVVTSRMKRFVELPQQQEAGSGYE
jgi:hypothetical protein